MQIMIVMAGFDPAIPGLAICEVGLAERIDHRVKPGDYD